MQILIEGYYRLITERINTYNGGGSIPHSKIQNYARYVGLDEEWFYDIIVRVDDAVMKHAQELHNKRSKKVEL